MELIVEQLGTTNNVLERQKFDRAALTIGRGLDNDVILPDEHVDARHARLFVDDTGRLLLEDLGSVNGIRRPRHKKRIDRTEVESGEVFLVGRSRLRVFRADHPVPPAVRIRFSEVFLLWLGKPQVAVVLGLLFVLAKVLETWLSTIGEFRWSSVIERNLAEVLLFGGLALGIYFLSVLFRRGGNFLAHLGLLIVLFLVSALLEFALTVGLFNAGDRAYPPLRWMADARTYLLLFFYFWSVLYLAFHVPLLRRTWISALIVVTWFGVDHLPEDSMTRFVASQTFPLEQTWLPPALRLTEARDAQAFRERAWTLFDALDERRAEALAERAERGTADDGEPGATAPAGDGAGGG